MKLNNQQKLDAFIHLKDVYSERVNGNRQLGLCHTALEMAQTYVKPGMNWDDCEEARAIYNFLIVTIESESNRLVMKGIVVGFYWASINNTGMRFDYLNKKIKYYQRLVNNDKAK